MRTSTSHQTDNETDNSRDGKGGGGGYMHAVYMYALYANGGDTRRWG